MTSKDESSDDACTSFQDDDAELILCPPAHLHNDLSIEVRFAILPAIVSVVVSCCAKILLMFVSLFEIEIACYWNRSFASWQLVLLLFL